MPLTPVKPVTLNAWWTQSHANLHQQLSTSHLGLTSARAAEGLRRYGQNRLAQTREPGWLKALLSRLANPLVQILIAASLISAATGDGISFAFVMLTVSMSIVLDVVQEHCANRAIQSLKQSLALNVRAWRDGALTVVPASELVPGDCVELSAGDLIAADGAVLKANAFFVNQSSLTGEAYPAEKRAESTELDSEDALSCSHAVFMGSSVVSGSATVLICATGLQTELGRLAHLLAQEAPPTSFERGIRRFSRLLTQATMALVLLVLLVNALYHRPMLESFLFAVALAVGLTPELLPMIVSVTLAHGAVRMARGGVVVKRSSAVQDLGAMDVLCTDKTGTLTEAKLCVERVMNAQGRDDEQVFHWAWLNSHFETGLKSPLDEAILSRGQMDAGPWRKQDEVPFDFERRRVSVLLENEGQRLLIVKGAPEDILRLSTFFQTPQGPQALDETWRTELDQMMDACGQQGLRLLAVATRHVPDKTLDVTASDEHDFVFAGFVAFSDPPKLSTAAALQALGEHGVAIKIVTGDNEAVTRHLCKVLQVPVVGVLTGTAIAAMDDLSLRAAAERTNLFCRVTPEQKNRVVRALQSGGHVVGYLGDGINDAPPLRSADVGISVDSAVDVAREAADLVLLNHDLDVLRRGIREGRRTLINVNKYVLMATSSNFGNMVSMAAAALFLPFLPMRPVQILLNNFLYDLSELPIPTDRVDDADVAVPRRWDITQVRNFMLSFGLLSSVFDLATFFLLAKVMQVSEAVFQSAWFMESMATQVLVIFLIRTVRPWWRDRPSVALALSSLLVAAVACMLPFMAWTSAIGFAPPSAGVVALIVALTVAYLTCAEALKLLFYRWIGIRHFRDKLDAWVWFVIRAIQLMATPRKR